MFEQFTPYKPKYLAEDMILSAELRERGGKMALKRCAKEKLTAAGSCRWDRSKKGKKTDKKAMIIMASQYDLVVEQLDIKEGKVLELEAKTKSQEEEIKLLKLKRQQWDKEESQVLQLMSKVKSQEEEIKVWQQKLQQWKEEYELLNCKVSQMKTKRDSQKKEITSLKWRVKEQEEENEQLKDKMANYDTRCDDSKNSLQLLVPVTYSASWKRSLLSLLPELPDLQNDNSNYMFWAKIKSWLIKGEVDPQGIFELVRIKCPSEAWQAIEKDLSQMAYSNPATMGSQRLQKLWKCVSEALGPGIKQFERYYYKRQNDSETFEEYLQEKFSLYCSYGVDDPEPDKNDRHFLCNVIERASKRYKALETMCPKSYSELLNKAMVIDSMLTAAEWNNECLNCCRKGHTKAECRRPGGDAEVGPNQCFTCGEYGHRAKKCWAYQ